MIFMTSLPEIFSAIDKFADSIAEKIAQKIVGDFYEDNITLEFCTGLSKDECYEHPEIEFVVLSVKKNDKPQNDKDNFLVTISFLDSDRKMLIVKNGFDEYIFHAGTVDEKIMKFLDGKPSVTARIKFQNTKKG